MENKERTQPFPEELKDEQLDAVTGGSTMTEPTKDIVTGSNTMTGTTTDIVMGHGVSLLDLITITPTEVVHEPLEKPDPLSSAHSALEAYRSEVQTLADEPALPSELQLRK